MTRAAARALGCALALGAAARAAGAQSIGEIVAFRTLLHTPAGAIPSELTTTPLQPGVRRFGAHLHYAVIHSPLRFGDRTLSGYAGGTNSFIDMSQTLGASLDARLGGRIVAAGTVGRVTSRCRSGTCERTLLAGGSVHSMLASTRFGKSRRAARLAVGAEGAFGAGWVDAEDDLRVRAHTLSAGVPLTLDFTVDNPSWSRDRVRRYDTRTYVFLSPTVAAVGNDADDGAGDDGPLAVLNGGIGVGVDAPAVQLSLTLAVRRAIVSRSEMVLGIGTSVRW
ncbi:MAG TPA: hypothetical protein VKA84_10765 [Gemmatimonadaceae bacterium]|nr:hypothetical protein [Gemmatimonadaceae bacterium]